MDEKISIIVPVYNTDHYLEKCIQSILDQTYKNLEIICIDDGSTDNSGYILDEFANKDQRIRVVHKQNEGVSIARNVGLKMVTGQWIGFVDSDDYISESMYETMLKANKGQGADIISCGYFLEYEDRCVKAINKKDVPSTAIETPQFYKYIYERDEYKGVASYLWTRLISRNILYTKSGELLTTFSSEYDVSEDLVFLAEVMQRSENSLYVSDSMYYYLQRESSASRDEKKQLEKLSWIRAYQRIIEIFEQNRADEEVMNLIKRMLVYRCGRFMELAIKHQDRAVYSKLEEIIEAHIEVYKVTNQEYPERIEWLHNLLQDKLMKDGMGMRHERND